MLPVAQDPPGQAALVPPFTYLHPEQLTAAQTATVSEAITLDFAGAQRRGVWPERPVLRRTLASGRKVGRVRWHQEAAQPLSQEVRPRGTAGAPGKARSEAEGGGILTVRSL